ncbi:hypothetical protein PYW07_016649 [Mythimna separata]|uniref:Uncharacterized protein n=1 Tax=Mythimna separata TaxID=271217 RepID=A0AAD7YLM6_MYTSE|nr:hypothetical protein PYW07_016649 [Mythimna separata]
MYFKFAVLFGVVLLFVDTEGFVKRDVNATAIDSLKKNMDEFRSCVDKSLANIVGEVNEDHLKPLFSVIGDQLNRFSKAFDELTKPKPSPEED